MDIINGNLLGDACIRVWKEKYLNTLTTNSLYPSGK